MKALSQEEFRFHTGSIKSQKKEIHEHAICQFCFDSILVRLKEHIGRLSTTAALSFDSILVRLKDYADEAWNFQHLPVFRFHTGSIKSLHEAMTIYVFTFRFHTGSIKSYQQEQI